MKVALSALFTGLLVVSVGCASRASVEAKRARGLELVRALSSPVERDAAYCELLRLRLHRPGVKVLADACAPVTDVVDAPQAAGPPMRMVLTDPGYPIDRGPTRRGPAGPFTLFEADGSIVPIFSNANMVIHDSEVFVYSPRGENAVGHAFGYSDGDAFGPNHFSVHALHVVPTALVQTSALTVILGPPTFGFEDGCRGDFWSWRYDDTDGDGWQDIQIGPRLDASGGIAPAATFRWSSAQGRYVGPTGAPEAGFLVYDATDCDAVGKIHERFAAYWRSRQAERQGHRLASCRSSTLSSIDIDPIPD
jgi:hypothetical protein